MTIRGLETATEHFLPPHFALSSDLGIGQLAVVILIEILVRPAKFCFICNLNPPSMQASGFIFGSAKTGFGMLNTNDFILPIRLIVLDFRTICHFGVLQDVVLVVH